MSNLELVTGYRGYDHVTAEQQADLQAGIVGSDCYVFPIGEQLRAEAVTSNKVRIFDGVCMAYGRQVQIDEGAYEDVTIENGTAGLFRNDIIIIKYVKDEASGIEGVTFEVLKGQTGETAADPTPNEQDIRTGVFESEIPLYRVRLNGLAIEAIEALYYVPKTQEELSRLCIDLQKQVASLNSNITYINAATYKDGSSFNKNFTAIGIQNEKHEYNKRAFFRIAPDDQENWSNIPPNLLPDNGTFIGVREVYYYSSTVVMVKVSEIHPNPGRQFFRTYNNGSWNSSGWKVIDPQ